MPGKQLLAADRVRAYLTLVPFLLERGQVSVDEAAREFGVSPGEMRTLVEKLTVIGLPGDNGYWQQPHEMFDINWDLLDDEDIIEITNDVALRRVPRFTAREAAALLAGLQFVSALPEVTGSALVDELIAKLARATADAPADVVIAPTEIADEVRKAVDEALRRGVALSFRYRAPDAPETIRTVDPVRVLITEGRWYLQGWCHLRTATRTFLLDRVSDPELTDIPITHADAQVSTTLAETATGEPVSIRVPASFAALLGDYLHTAEVETDASGILHARIPLADPRSVKRLAARFGGALEVHSPGAARDATREWAAAGLALYTQPIRTEPGLD